MDKFSFTSIQGLTEVFYCNEPYLPPLKNKNAIYIADTNTAQIVRSSENFSSSIPFVIIDCGEENKNFTSLELILKTALDSNLTRQAVFIGIGGGVVCDLTAFAASVYMRGVKCILVPTTVLAMADASIGGKTAINFHNYKNMVGSFFKADEIYISTKVLHTLEEKEYLSGLAEILKIALLYSPSLYRIFNTEKSKILKRDETIVLEIIRRAVIAKSNVVVRDFYEKGERAFLNFGHTFAHALERVCNFSITHGQAVLWGICRALKLGEKLKITSPDYADEIINLIKDYGFCTDTVSLFADTSVTSSEKDLKINFADKIVNAMKKDKKNTGNNIKLILQKNIEETIIFEADEKDIKEVLI